MLNRTTTLFAAACLFALGAVPALAQTHVPAPEMPASPLAMTQATLGDGTYLKVTYGSPRMRDREIFGELVPYGQVWRLGANEATEITTTQDVMLGGETLPAGTYTLFAVPNEDSWDIIVNSDLQQWGNYSHNEDNDLMTITVPAQTMDESHEAFTIAFTEDGSALNMMWDDTMVSIPVSPATM